MLQTARYSISRPVYVRERKKESSGTFNGTKASLPKPYNTKEILSLHIFQAETQISFTTSPTSGNFLGIKANIEMLYLADEMFRQKGKKIELVFGKTIPWQTFDKSRTPVEWAEWVKGKSYELKSFIT